MFGRKKKEQKSGSDQSSQTKLVGEIIKVIYSYLALGNRPISLYSIELKDGSLARAGIYGHTSELVLGDLVEVSLSKNTIANELSIFRFEQKDGTVVFSEEEERVYYKRIKSYKKLTHISVFESDQ